MSKIIKEPSSSQGLQTKHEEVKFKTSDISGIHHNFNVGKGNSVRRDDRF